MPQGIKRFSLSHQRLKDEAGKASSKIQLFKFGVFEHWSGDTFEVNEEFMDQMIANFKKCQESSKDPDVIAIDYNHGSLSYGPEEAAASGWIMDLIKEEDGLYAQVKWTNRARKYIEEEEYKYISPEFTVNPRDEYGEKIEGAFLYAAALTNRPFLKGMDSVKIAAFEKKLNDLSQKLCQKGDGEMREKLAKLLALKDDSEDSVIKAIESARSIVANINKALSLKEGEDPVERIKTLVAAAEQSSDRVEKLENQVKLLNEQGKKKEAESFVEQLCQEDKIDPAQKETWMSIAMTDIAQAKKLSESLQSKNRTRTFGSGQGKNEEEDETLESAVRTVMKEKNLEYVVALKQVQVDRPELVAKHASRPPKKQAAN